MRPSFAIEGSYFLLGLFRQSGGGGVVVVVLLCSCVYSGAQNLGTNLFLM